jgi:glycosyltransferase involved in cell wall biosynthesis
MRISIFSNAYKPTISGVVVSISLFRQGLLDQGHDVHIFAPEYEGYQDEELYVFRFPSLDLSEQLDFSLALPFKNLIEPTVRGVKSDLIHSQHPLWMGDLAVSFAEDLKLPLVFTFHTQYERYVQHYIPLAPDLAGKLMEGFVGRYLQHCDHIVTPTASVRDQILRDYAVEAPVTVVPTPVNLSQFRDLNPHAVRTKLGLTDHKFLLYVGRLSKEKELGRLLQSFARVLSDCPRARLILLGRGPIRESLQKKAKKLGIRDAMEFVDAVPHHQVPDYMAAADLFVFPSTTETQGLVLVEAMAAGTPVVAVQAPGLVDVVSKGGGVLVPQDEEAFAAAVIHLLEDDQARLAMQAKAKATADLFSVETASRQLIDVYEQTLQTYKDRSREK